MIDNSSTMKQPLLQRAEDNNLSVLIIEDESMVADYLKETLTGRRHPVFFCSVAADLAGGLARLSRERFDVVLLDLGLPDSRGIDTAVNLRKMVPTVPIVVLTGIADEETGLDSLRLDIQDFLIKSQVSENLLVHSIRHAIELKRIIDALRESEGKFRAFFESVAVGAALFDPATGLFAQVNDRFCGMTGYEREELLSLTFNDITHPQDRGRDQRMFQRALMGKHPEYTIEKRFLRKDGTFVWVQVATALVWETAGRPVRAIKIVQDITERKRAEEALKKNEALLNETQAISRTGGWELDIASGRITWTDEVYRIYGVSRDFNPSNVPEDMGFYESDELPRLKEAFGKAVRDGEPYDLQLRFRNARGERLWVRTIGKPVKSGGRVIKISGNISDITDRKQAEEALRGSEERLRLAAQAANFAMYDLSMETGMVFLSPELKNLYGLDPWAGSVASIEEVLRFVHPAERDMIRQVMETSADPRGAGRFQVEHRVLRADRTVLWVNMRGQTFFQGTGEYRRPVRTTGVLIDITERRLAEDALRQSEERYRALVYTASSAVWRTSADGAVLIEYTGAGTTECKVARPIRNLIDSIHPDDRERTLETWLQAVKTRTLYEAEHRTLHPDGTWHYYLSRGVPVMDETGQVREWMGSSIDITERRKLEEQVRHMAQHDPLTDLPNRRLFVDILKIEFAQARRHRSRAAILFLDLDRFKEINDTLGHEVGDRLLREVAARFRNTIRASDTVARIGGDEFNIVLSDINRSEDISDIARKLIQSLERPVLVDDHRLSITTSIGISVYPGDSEDTETLLRYADIAMYSAKEKGRNGFQFYDSSMNRKTVERIRLESMLRGTLERGELVLYYQPEVDIATKKTACVEALSRWKHPERGLLTSGQFIPLAEETGFINALDAWAVRTACLQAKEWRELAQGPVCVTVNLASRCLRSPDEVKLLALILEETGADPASLELEITESAAMTDIERTAPVLKKIAEMGIRISIDDFGTGYSSLNHLKKLPIGKLKIDRSFIRDIATDTDDQAIIAAVTSMARKLGITTVAEGVETEEQFQLVREAGCDEAQGYLFSMPLAAAQFEDYILYGPNSKAA